MKRLAVAIVSSIVVLGATSAWAQFGLYGSPETLDLLQPQAATPTNYATYATSPPAHRLPSYGAGAWAGQTSMLQAVLGLVKHSTTTILPPGSV